MLSSGILAHVLGRYLSIVLIIITNVGFFHHGFSPKACDHYFHVGPIFKGTFPLPYAACVREADQSFSLPGHGVTYNPGCQVGLGHPAPYSRI